MGVALLGGMTQQLRALLFQRSEFNSQQSHGGSQPFVMRSGALLRKISDQSPSLIETMKPNMDKVNRMAAHAYFSIIKA